MEKCAEVLHSHDMTCIGIWKLPAGHDIGNDHDVSKVKWCDSSLTISNSLFLKAAYFK